MFLFRPGRKTLFYSLLLFSLFVLAGCKNPDSSPSIDPTQITVISPGGIPVDILDSLEVTLAKANLPGTAEPFFSAINSLSYNRENLPTNADLLILVSTAAALSDSSLGRVLSPGLISRVTKEDEVLFLKKDDLYRKGQTIWFILHNSDSGLQKFVAARFPAAVATMISTNIKRVMAYDQSRSRYEKGHSEEILAEWGIDLRLPEGFERVDSVPSGSTLFRRGAGTKTEEWMMISGISGSIEGNPDELRDNAVKESIRYQDGSSMRTTSYLEYLGKPGYFRGNWETSPYPMAGVYTARLLSNGGGIIYIEAGIYSPGRNKTLNLLRLEKLLRDL